MSTFRVNKNVNYTVMSNHHLQDKRLSLKAKGLLSYMLSLPDDWNYSLKGLTIGCKDGLDSVRTAVLELEEHGCVRTEIHYAQVGEYQLPLLTMPQTDDTEPLGKYGRMRLVYLKNQRPVLYNRMLLNGTLWPHLQDVQRAASEQLKRTIAEFPAPDKERAQLLWAVHMNGLKAQAEEVVVREIVYTEVYPLEGLC